MMQIEKSLKRVRKAIRHMQKIEQALLDALDVDPTHPQSPVSSTDTEPTYHTFEHDDAWLETKRGWFGITRRGASVVNIRLSSGATDDIAYPVLGDAFGAAMTWSRKGHYNLAEFPNPHDLMVVASTREEAQRIWNTLNV